MRIGIIAPEPVPVARGGAQRAWSGLAAAVNERTSHRAEVMTVPVDERTLPGLVAGYRAFAELDTSPFDLIVTSKYPAWMSSHPNHVVHMFHPLRGLYDTYHLLRAPPSCPAREPAIRAVLDLVREAPRREVLPLLFDRLGSLPSALGPDHPELCLPSPLAREVITWLDRLALDPVAVQRHLALSATVAARPGYFPPGVTARVVYLPSNLPGLGPGAAEHLFTASRLDPPKRIELLIRAMAHVEADVPLLIGGEGPAETELRDLADGDDRIRFLGPVDDGELARLYADALAVGFVPRDEDYGLIAVEAMACAKPVVTCHDTGGPTELVVDGVTGLVTAASAQALGDALSRLVANPSLAERLGRAGAERATSISWETALRVIIGNPRPIDHPVPKADPAPPRSPRPKLVAVSTFAIDPPLGGGQLRCVHLYGALARRFDVEMVSLVHQGTAPGTATIAPGCVATVVPASAIQERLADDWSMAVGIPVSDIVAGSVTDTTPDYIDALTHALTDASAVVLAHPYLHPAVEHVRPDLPVIYDAFDHEAGLKAAVLPDTAPGRSLLERVRTTEARAVDRAGLVVACSSQDGARLAGARRRSSGTVIIPNGTLLGPPPPTPQERAEAGRRWCRRFADHAPTT
ncbi:MAG: glycosyltransferase [Acidimicrobiales bacterium]